MAEWRQQYTNFVPGSHSMLDTLHNADESDTLALNVGFQVFAALFK